MTKSATIAAAALLLIAAFAAPVPARAHTPEDPISLPFWGSPILSCTAQDHPSLRGEAVRDICNDFCDILHTAQHVLYFMITILVFIVVPLAFLSGGFLWMLSRGNTEMVSKGTAMMKGAVIGVVVVLLAFVIVNTILTFIGRNPDGPKVAWGTFACQVSAPAP